ncbi:MAG: winged helix-turn-helix domain-containing protein [Terriglobia bacterium]|jgi:transposase
MGNPKGVRRDFDALEQRRFAALRLLRQGLNQSEVARRLRVGRQSVARWAALDRKGGERALRQAGRAGRKPRLTPRQKARLEQRLLAGPERLGYETSLWTSERVADLIEQEFKVRYHPGHVWKILVALGWSCQRPTGRALERNEEAIRHWQKITWPDIKKKPKKSGERSSFSTKAD